MSFYFKLVIKKSSGYGKKICLFEYIVRQILEKVSGKKRRFMNESYL